MFVNYLAGLGAALTAHGSDVPSYAWGPLVLTNAASLPIAVLVYFYFPRTERSCPAQRIGLAEPLLGSV